MDNKELLKFLIESRISDLELRVDDINDQKMMTLNAFNHHALSRSADRLGTEIKKLEEKLWQLDKDTK